MVRLGVVMLALFSQQAPVPSPMTPSAPHEKLEPDYFANRKLGRGVS